MKSAEAKRIIVNYQPHPGFFDLSERPVGMPEPTYAKILKAQNFLVEQNGNAKYLKQYCPSQWEKLKEFSAELQHTILRYWNIEEFPGVRA